ncbi:Uncharacterised protein [BD1-7 clade bacterium]|uniref:SRPBCC family protein n=1 Tax=BD1-7 clade bacterium TaxID=2029982 RepID=A0A5S9NQN3_9GAMM|nr:Uncharacterised protein [BD1-7 clade bacterium]
MRAKTSSILNAPADDVWPLVKKSSTLFYVTKGFLGFADADQFPHEWREGVTKSTRLLFFGFLPAWKHRIGVQKINDSEHLMYTNEGGGLVPTWNHLIKVEPLSAHTCRYIDDVEIKAGLLTPLTWVYAKMFYRYRQWRWRSLLNSEHRNA